MSRRLHYEENKRRRLRPAFLDYVDTRSVAETARRQGISRETFYRWLEDWVRQGSGDPLEDWWMIIGAAEILRNRAAPVVNRPSLEDLFKRGRAVVFDVKMAFLLAKRLDALDYERADKEWRKLVTGRRGKRFSEVLEDAAKNKG
jgi:transposase-like protein